VRITDSKASITHKGPVQPSEHFKIREERESAVEDGAIVLQIFEQIGFRVWFRYQKFRQEYDIALGGAGRHYLRVAVDETPVGDFAEFEGSEEGIREVTRSMGFNDSQYLRDSYYALYLKHCARRGVVPGHMVFPARNESNNSELSKGR
jgi:adenylate cyclase class 2